jgi:hypothetical protein
MKTAGFKRPASAKTGAAQLIRGGAGPGDPGRPKDEGVAPAHAQRHEKFEPLSAHRAALGLDKISVFPVLPPLCRLGDCGTLCSQ